MFTELKALVIADDSDRAAGDGAGESSGPLPAVSSAWQWAKRGVREVGAKTGVLEQQEEEGLIGQANSAVEETMSECPALTYKQRVTGALGCLAVGFVLDFFATLSLLGGKAHLADYASLYTLGNVVAICGSGFVVGPCRQAKLMCHPVRRGACAMYIGAMVLTLVVAFEFPVPPLLLLLLVVQYVALVWYGASFLPFGRACIVAACKKASAWCQAAVLGT